MKSHTYKRHPNCVVTEKLNEGGKEEVKRRGGEIFVKILLVPLSGRSINKFYFHSSRFHYYISHIKCMLLLKSE